MPPEKIMKKKKWRLPMTEKKEKDLFPSFKKRDLKKEKLEIKKEHKEIVAPPGQ